MAKPPPKSTPVNAVGKAALRSLRAIPLVRDKVIPWLVREEIDQMPTSNILAAMRREMRLLAKGRGHILVGPWMSEVGFELLYWIPFLRWAVEEFKLDPSRLIAVSRGGVSSWYADVAGGYADVFDLYSVDEYRQAIEARWETTGNQKQYDPTDFDREISGRVSERLGITVGATLHPYVMYRMLRFYWYEKAPVSLLLKHTKYAALAKPALPPDRYGLPEHYTAIRFYFRPSFPDTPENRALVRSVIERQAAQQPVVLLNTGIRFDDHDDVEVGARGVYRIDHALTPRDNLSVQTAVIANADRLIGTYGGLSYLGPYLGVPTVGFYSDQSELVPAHLDITWRLSGLMQSPLTVLGSADVALLRTLFGEPAKGTGPTVA